MEKLFLIVFNMSATGSAIILFVLLLRLLLRRAPKAFSYALWAVVLFRLLCPFTLKSSFSLAPDLSAEPLMVNRTIHIYPGDNTTYVFPTPTPDVPGQTALVLPEGVAGVPAAFIPEKASGPRLSVTGSWIWLAGVVLLLGYSAWSLLRLRRKLVGNVPLAGEKNVRLADHIPSPFVLGILRPKIYLPSNLPVEERDYILLHERTHIRRCDHILRALAWLALAAHWFNPLVWLAFHLAGKDMEMSCDEAVLRKMGRDIRADYSASLLRLSQGERLPAGPLAFGGGDPKSRIENVLSYKKPAVWVMALALVAVVCVTAAMATEPGDLIEPDSVVSGVAFNARSFTLTEYNTIVYTAADRWKDFDNLNGARMIAREDAAGLVRLLNLYRRTVYAHGEMEYLNGSEHNFVRLDCADGGFYLVDFWYWNGFSFHPLHMGEDSYTTLVTYYDAQGRAGTTWQMEYSFDRAYKDWRRGVTYTDGDSGIEQNGGDGDHLVFFYNEARTDVIVKYGKAGDMWWHIPGRSDAADDRFLLGAMSFSELKFKNGWTASGAVQWTGEGRTAVKLELISAPLVLDYTILTDLDADPGIAVLRRHIQGNEGSDIPITDADAIQAAQLLARYLRAAEEFYDSGGPSQ